MDHTKQPASSICLSYNNNASALKNKQNIILLQNPGHKVTIKRDVKMRENQDDKHLQFFKSNVDIDPRNTSALLNSFKPCVTVPLGNFIFYTPAIDRVSYQL